MNQLLAFEAPSGPAWLFLGVAAATILGPVVAVRLRLPPIVGLLAAGLVIGPNVLDIVPSTDQTVPALGQLGLLYLMFNAGAELDLVLFRHYRKAAVVFGLVTFACPMVLGFAAGEILEYSLPASLLLGSLWASHTLVTYPMARRAGLSGNRAVATAVGATVLTDTLSLMILAGVSATQTGESELGEVIGELGLGLVLLGAYCFVALPWATQWFFRGPGGDRELRFAYLLGAMLSAGVLAEVVGIEGIVGAFFAGLGLNRLVPGSSPLMERLEFFGSAVLVPVFVISVGLLIQPSVMVSPATLGVAAVYLGAVCGGKALAALLARPLLGFSWGESSLMFGLTLSQAAATLAATTVGYDIGLFGEQVVNAVLVVILITLLVAAITTERSVGKVEPTALELSALGRKVLVVPGNPQTMTALARVAAAVVRTEGGMVVPLRVRTPGGSADDDEAILESAEAALTKAGLDVEAKRRLTTSVISGVSYSIVEESATLLLVDWDLSTPSQRSLRGARDDNMVAASGIPVLLAAMSDATVQRVVVAFARSDLAPQPSGDAVLAAQIACRLADGVEERLVVGPSSVDEDETLAALLAPLDCPPVDPEHQDRIVWMHQNLRSGDLLVLPAEPAWARFGPAALQASLQPGVSIVVAADPQRWTSVRNERWQLDALVGQTPTAPRWH